MSVTTRVIIVAAIVGGLALGAGAVATASLPHIAAAPSQKQAAKASPTVHPSAKGDEASEAKESPEPSETPEAKASPGTKATPQAGPSGQSEED